MHALIVHTDAFASQQRTEPAVAEARARGCQFAQPFAQGRFVGANEARSASLNGPLRSACRRDVR